MKKIYKLLLATTLATYISSPANSETFLSEHALANSLASEQLGEHSIGLIFPDKLPTREIRWPDSIPLIPTDIRPTDMGPPRDPNSYQPGETPRYWIPNMSDLPGWRIHPAVYPGRPGNPKVVQLIPPKRDADGNIYIPGDDGRATRGYEVDYTRNPPRLVPINIQPGSYSEPVDITDRPPSRFHRRIMNPRNVPTRGPAGR